MTRVMRKLYYRAHYHQLRARGFKWLFVLGHMRTGSSLLVHILNTNPEILGYGETKLKYRGRHSLAKLYDHVLEEFEAHGGYSKHPTYIMDKILGHHVLNRQVFSTDALRCIVIVRDPIEALPSILSRDLPLIQSPGDALDYYSRTLSRIKMELEAYDRPFVFLKYSQLVNESDQVLRRITDYLDLREPLVPEYNPIWSTGKPGIGDSSPRIRKGNILNQSNKYDIHLPNNIRKNAEEMLHQFTSHISSNTNML